MNIFKAKILSLTSRHLLLSIFNYASLSLLLIFSSVFLEAVCSFGVLPGHTYPMISS